MEEIEPTKIIIRKMTKSQLVSLGGNIFIQSKKWTWLGAFCFSVVFAFVLLGFYKHTTVVDVLSIIPMAAVLVGFVYTMNKAGNKFWERIKNEKEPYEIK